MLLARRLDLMASPRLMALESVTRFHIKIKNLGRDVAEFLRIPADPLLGHHGCG